MDLSGLEVWIIIILVVGIIASNLAVLKYSAKFKMPQFGDPKKPSNESSDIESPDTESDKTESSSDSDKNNTRH
ncbi:DUF2897 family protein [Shewanella olleyana]|uniref:DUF2897 family protein n=1 Tax=Shewanella olleyana TaxID=135626 RepID=UPI00200D60EB|nr:DUF2897 family protein [Shewanella olleyana]MCL1065503.1 DUF2897 family protein [Shewanella olleyana]